MMTNQKTTDGIFISDKLMDLANLEVIVLVFGQFTTAEINWYVVGVGVIIYSILVLVSLKLRRKKYGSPN